MFEISRVVALITIILNVIAIVGFSWVKKYLRREVTSKFASAVTVGIGGVFALYIIALALLVVFSITSKHYLYASLLFMPLVIPFVISYLSTYEKANMFINFQILTFVLSLFMVSTIFTHINADITKSNELARASNQPRKGILFYLKNDVTAKAKNLKFELSHNQIQR